jgi:hypothetical protein
VKQIISSTDDPRNLYPNLIDEAAAPYGDDVLAVAEAWKEELADEGAGGGAAYSGEGGG